MFDLQSYLRVILSLCGGLLTLLGSVGIFVSLTVQRRVERLQDILEEFMDLSYQSETNLTGKMYKLIEKYQMHYLVPKGPSRIIMLYVNLTIVTVILSWSGILLIGYRTPWQWRLMLYVLPVITGLGILLFYRFLLKNAINPVANALLSPLIPPPTHLRSVSYLSRYVNVSVKSILKHARLRLLVKTADSGAVVLLKEELSFDDYFYFLHMQDEDNRPVFTGFGELKMFFGQEAITGKPVPAARNVNVPLGFIKAPVSEDKTFEARFLIFPWGEKHPIEYIFRMHSRQSNIVMADEPEISVNYMITYRVRQNRLEIIEDKTKLAYFRELAPGFILDNRRRYLPGGDVCLPETVQICEQPIYIG
ncbi:MAG: hypothetical protein ACOY4Q_09875 [Bacillota bacterium]